MKHFSHLVKKLETFIASCQRKLKHFSRFGKKKTKHFLHFVKKIETIFAFVRKNETLFA